VNHTRIDLRNVTDVRQVPRWLLVENGQPDHAKTCVLRRAAITSWSDSGSSVEVFCDQVMYVFLQRPARNDGGESYEPYPALRRLVALLMAGLSDG
jgi:hypothetical protein